MQCTWSEQSVTFSALREVDNRSNLKLSATKPSCAQAAQSVYFRVTSLTLYIRQFKNYHFVWGISLVQKHKGFMFKRKTETTEKLLSRGMKKKISIASQMSPSFFTVLDRTKTIDLQWGAIKEAVILTSEVQILEILKVSNATHQNWHFQSHTQASMLFVLLCKKNSW